jgi:hypothetical protein
LSYFCFHIFSSCFVSKCVIHFLFHELHLFLEFFYIKYVASFATTFTSCYLLFIFVSHNIWYLRRAIGKFIKKDRDNVLWKHGFFLLHLSIIFINVRFWWMKLFGDEATFHASNVRPRKNHQNINVSFIEEESRKCWGKLFVNHNH